MTKFIMVAGGVISGVGKGVVTASLGKIMQKYGYKTTLIKIDPYINFDAGTLRPTEHGEVWVTADGGEIDQDLGTYERFIAEPLTKKNSITTGQIYKAVIDRERAGEYLGKTVQFVPHIIEEVKNRIIEAAEGYEIAIVEIGGIVGDYENVPYLHAFKSLEREFGADAVANVLVVYVPIPRHIGEMKTKPAQQAIRLMGQEGVLPDFIVCRAEVPLDDIRRKKIEDVANVPMSRILNAPDVSTIYQVPFDLEAQNMGKEMLAHLNLKPRQTPDWHEWQELISTIKDPKETVTIGLVGKYVESGDFSLTDSYLSVAHALTLAGAYRGVGVKMRWLDAKLFENGTENFKVFDELDGVIVPGGFGSAGVEGKIAAISFARTHEVPYLGLCYGLQLAVVEYARNMCGMQGAHTTEVDTKTPYPVIDFMPLQKDLLEHKAYGGTMRLGSYRAQVKPDSRIALLYKDLDKLEADNTVVERHRHRYEVNNTFVAQLEKAGLVFSGYYDREDGTRLMEFIELSQHPYFVATQAHPEFTSRVGSPNPLFVGLVDAARTRMHARKTE